MLTRVQSLIGKKCTRASINYNNELHLYFGTRWKLITFDSIWSFSTPLGSVTSKSRNKNKLQRAIELIEHIPVFNIELWGKTLRIYFQNDCLISIIPKSINDKFDAPYFELFMPRNEVLSFGPHNKWSKKKIGKSQWSK